MTSENTITYNKLITEFLGYKLARCNNGLAWESPFKYAVDILKIHGRLYRENEPYHYNYLRFDISYEWQMFAIAKIESLGFDVQMKSHHCRENCKNKIRYFCLIDKMGSEHFSHSREVSMINATYLAVVDFILWYNKSKGLTNNSYHELETKQKQRVNV